VKQDILQNVLVDLFYNNEWGMELLILNNVNKSVNELHVKVVQMTCVQYLIVIKSYDSFR